MQEPAEQHDRTRYLGSSDAGAIVGVDPDRTALDIWRVKTGRIPPWQPTPEQAGRLRRGKLLEPIARDMAIDKLRQLGHDVELVASNERYFDPVFPFLTAEVDADLRVDGVLINAEIKTASGYLRHQWGEEGGDDIALRYAAQPVHALAVTGRPRCLVAALIGLDDIALFWIERDEEVIAGLRQRLVDFWHSNVIADVAPLPRTIEDVKTLHPVDNGRSVEATPAMVRAVARLHEIRRQKRELSAEDDALVLQVAQHMGPASRLKFKGRDLCTFRQSDQSHFDLDAFRAEEPLLAADYLTTRSVRTLRLSKLKDRL